MVIMRKTAISIGLIGAVVSFFVEIFRAVGLVKVSSNATAYVFWCSMAFLAVVGVSEALWYVWRSGKGR